MPTFLPNEIYERLIADLSGTFMAAATSTGADLRGKIAEALACAGVLPDVCGGDFLQMEV